MDEHGKKPALRVERPLPPLGADGTAPPSLPVDQWQTWNFGKYYEDVRTAARGFISLGLTQFGTVTVFGFNAPEWHISAMAAVFVGAKPAGIYPTDTPEVIAYKTNHSDATIAVVEDEGKFKKYCSCASELTSLTTIVAWGFTPQVETVAAKDGRTINVLSWSQLMKAGGPASGELEAKLESSLRAIKPGHCAALIYTSGTTGNPKAVMTSHDNFIAEAFNGAGQIEGLGNSGQERVLSYLPLSHVAGMMVDIIMPLVGTALIPGDGYTTMHFARPYDLKASTIGDRLRAVRPTVCRHRTNNAVCLMRCRALVKAAED